MSTLFPFGFSFPTAFYLVLYVVTWVLHALFMSYVIAGTGYLVYAALTRRQEAGVSTAHGLAPVLLDWMPVAVSATVTAGVAPLLFVQLLHQTPFYTANLLLFHRWMAILPVLIAGAYLLYLMLHTDSRGFSRGVRSLLAAGAFACFLFTAYSWTENHMLSLHSELWPTIYSSSSRTTCDPDTGYRLLFLLTGCVPTMLVLVLWQLYGYDRSCGRPAPEGEVRHAGFTALGFLGLSFAAGLLYMGLAQKSVAAVCFSWIGSLWCLLGLAGLGLEAWAFRTLWRTGCLCSSTLLLATSGTCLRWLAIGIVRESIRLGSSDLVAESARHAAVYKAGGFGTFLTFAVLNVALLALCTVVVARGLAKPGAGATPPEPAVPAPPADSPPAGTPPAPAETQAPA